MSYFHAVLLLGILPYKRLTLPYCHVNWRMSIYFRTLKICVKFYLSTKRTLFSWMLMTSSVGIINEQGARTRSVPPTNEKYYLNQDCLISVQNLETKNQKFF